MRKDTSNQTPISSPAVARLGLVAGPLVAAASYALLPDEYRDAVKDAMRKNRWTSSLKAVRRRHRLEYHGVLHDLRDEQQWERFLNRLVKHDWVVYCKRPFGGPRQVLRYLARYTHRVAISDHRLQQVTSQSVTFSYKDYRDGGAAKSMTLKGEEFLRRFLLHVLPDGFMRIRYYGFLANGVRTEKLKLIRQRLIEDAPGETKVPDSERQTSWEPPAAQDKGAGCCPECHKGTMQHLEELPAERPLPRGNEHRGPPEAIP